MTTLMTCPSCNYTRQSTDTFVPDWECPRCQKAYNKSAQASELPTAQELKAVPAWDGQSQQEGSAATYDCPSSPPTGMGAGLRNIFLTFFMILAAIGLVLSVIVHWRALFGMEIPFAKEAWGLHVGIFLVWFPAMIAVQRLAPGVIVGRRFSMDVYRKDYWQTVLRGCPAWMKYLTYFFFGYAIFNFAIFIFGSGSHSGKNITNELRGFSGHWMAFYSAAMSILYSAIHVAPSSEPTKCPNGHSVSPLAKFCEECGSPVRKCSR